MKPALLALFLVCAGAAQADLKRALAEQNLEKRSTLAMDNASAAFKAARAAYEKGDNDETAKSIAEVLESVDLAAASLNQSGKNPRRSDAFKKAEIATRDLARRIDSFQTDMSYADRELLDKLKSRVQQVHDELLVGVMEGKKKE